MAKRRLKFIENNCGKKWQKCENCTAFNYTQNYILINIWTHFMPPRVKHSPSRIVYANGNYTWCGMNNSKNNKNFMKTDVCHNSKLRRRRRRQQQEKKGEQKYIIFKYVLGKVLFVISLALQKIGENKFWSWSKCCWWAEMNRYIHSHTLSLYGSGSVKWKITFLH